jgi:hypothetical protein
MLFIDRREIIKIDSSALIPYFYSIVVYLEVP